MSMGLNSDTGKLVSGVRCKWGKNFLGHYVKLHTVLTGCCLSC